MALSLVWLSFFRYAPAPVYHFPKGCGRHGRIRMPILVNSGPPRPHRSLPRTKGWKYTSIFPLLSRHTLPRAHNYGIRTCFSYSLTARRLPGYAMGAVRPPTTNQGVLLPGSAVSRQPRRNALTTMWPVRPGKGRCLAKITRMYAFKSPLPAPFLPAPCIPCIFPGKSDPERPRLDHLTEICKNGLKRIGFPAVPAGGPHW